jgi:DNA-binding CsgD family transcriptional regulator
MADRAAFGVADARAARQARERRARLRQDPRTAIEEMLGPSRPDRRRAAVEWGEIMRWALLPTSDRDELLDAVLDGLALPQDAAHRRALVHVHWRRPRGSDVPGWLRAIRRSRQFRRWLAAATTGAVRDERRRSRPAASPRADAALVELHLRLGRAGFTERQREALVAWLSGEPDRATAERLHLAASTVRRHRQVALRALQARGIDRKNLRGEIANS